MNDLDRLEVADGVLPLAQPSSTPPSIQDRPAEGWSTTAMFSRGTTPAGDNNRSSAPPSVEGGGAAGPPARPSAAYRAARMAGASVAAFLVAEGLGLVDPPPLVAALTGLLVVQATAASTMVNSVQRVLSVVAGVLLAVGFVSGGGADLVESVHPGGRVHHRRPAAATGPAPGGGADQRDAGARCRVHAQGRRRPRSAGSWRRWSARRSGYW